MSTVALSMIVKDEYEPVMHLIEQAVDYFDQINLVVSDKPTANKLRKNFSQTPSLNIVWREWNNHFDDARNVALEMCTTDYFFWIDADDTFDFLAVPQLVEIADENNIDAIFLPYNYMQDEQGNSITYHWRERLIRNNGKFEWRGWVHETCISDEDYTSHKVNIEVKHNTTFDDTLRSHARNHAILKEAYEATKDPRYLHYLGMSYYTLQDYAQSAEMLLQYLEVGGSVEDSYRSLSVISECAYHMKNYDMALEYASKTITLKPAYPMGYYLLAQYEADQKNWPEALEWARVGLSKPDPDTLSVYDPSARERAVLLAAQADYMMGNYNKGLAWLRKIPKNPTAQDLAPDFQDEADAEAFVNLLPKVRKFFTSDKALWNSLAPDMKYDTRIKALRNNVTEPKKWGDKSIVIFCGQGFEEWGPHTLDKGMGGSEEAVVYLAPELAALGYNVTVYAEYDSGNSNLVDWRPWQEIDTRDEFNIFVSWRAPQFLEHINAKVKLADIHDVLPPSVMKNYPDVTYLVKTNYHRSLTPDLPDDKFAIIGNGIKKDQFHD
jgi:glycosyltransferase involved in cell wall biosynthesis